jgi:hypothetical protein
MDTHMPNGFQATSTININAGRASRIGDYKQIGMRSAEGRQYASKDARVTKGGVPGYSKASVINDYVPRKNARPNTPRSPKLMAESQERLNKSINKGRAKIHPNPNASRPRKQWTHGVGSKKMNSELQPKSSKQIKNELASIRRKSKKGK